MKRLKTFADNAGRDMASLSVSVFGAPADRDTLAGFEEAGIQRVLLPLPSATRDEILPVLDGYAALVD